MKYLVHLEMLLLSMITVMSLPLIIIGGSIYFKYGKALPEK